MIVVVFSRKRQPERWQEAQELANGIDSNPHEPATPAQPRRDPGLAGGCCVDVDSGQRSHYHQQLGGACG